jgi:hypothetical protein
MRILLMERPPPDDRPRVRERGGHVHVGQNQGAEPVVLYVTYLLPSGSAPATEATDPGCEG